MIDTATTALRTLADAVIEVLREHVSALELSDPLLVRLVPMLRRLQSDVLFVSRAVDELPGPGALANTLLPACQALSQVMGGLRNSCDAVARGAAGQQQDAAAGIAALDRRLDSLGDTAGAPLRFTLQMLRRDLSDMHLAIGQDRNGAR